MFVLCYSFGDFIHTGKGNPHRLAASRSTYFPSVPLADIYPPEIALGPGIARLTLIG